MKLESFIEESLIAICSGIEKAKNRLNTNNAVIAPGFIEGQLVGTLRFIDFEIVVTVNENNQLQVDGNVSGKAGIGFAGAKGSIDANIDQKRGQEDKSTKIKSVLACLIYLRELVIKRTRNEFRNFRKR